jgi:hypothetical protein
VEFKPTAGHLTFVILDPELSQPLSNINKVYNWPFDDENSKQLAVTKSVQYFLSKDFLDRLF